MSDKTVQQRVNDIVVELMGTPLELLKPEARLDEDLGLDSLDCVEFCIELENEFLIEIPDADAEAVKTLGAAAAYVEKRLNEKQ